MVDVPSKPTLEYLKPERANQYALHARVGFFLSIPGVFIFPLAIVGLGFGFSAYRHRKDLTPSCRRMAAIAMMLSCLGIFLIIASMFMLPELGRPRPAANRIKCQSNMRQIGLALKMYASENHDCYPPDFSTLIRNEEITPDVFICPSSDDDIDRSTTQPSASTVIPGTSHCSYIYLTDPALRYSTVSPDRIMVIEPLANHDGEGMNVLFGDGHVDWMDKIEANRVMAQLLIGHNPPWPPTSQPASTQP